MTSRRSLERMIALTVLSSVWMSCRTPDRAESKDDPANEGSGEAVGRSLAVAGDWVGPCASLRAGEYQRTRLSFHRETRRLTVKTSVGRDEACAEDQADWAKIEERHFELGGAAQAPHAFDVDYRVVEVKVFMSEGYRAEADAQALFGITDWVGGELRDVTGKRRETGASPERLPHQMIYSIIEANAERLFLGDDGSGDEKTPQTRPQWVSRLTPYKRP